MQVVAKLIEVQVASTLPGAGLVAARAQHLAETEEQVRGVFPPNWRSTPLSFPSVGSVSAACGAEPPRTTAPILAPRQPLPGMNPTAGTTGPGAAKALGAGSAAAVEGGGAGQPSTSDKPMADPRGPGPGGGRHFETWGVLGVNPVAYKSAPSHTQTGMRYLASLEAHRRTLAHNHTQTSARAPCH